MRERNTVERRGICPDLQRTSSEALLALKTTVTEDALRSLLRNFRNVVARKQYANAG